MYLHKENKELFRDAVLLASQKLEVSEDIVEKDYYVTMILKKLSAIEYPIVFKGGTSLSKAFQIIDRFSEDIDITFTEHLGEARRKKLKYNILKPIADDLGVEIRNFESIESDKNLNHYDFYYESVIGDRVVNAIPPYVKLETSLMSYAFPTEEKNLSNYIFDALGKEDYKNDYKETTLKLISDSLSYEQVIKNWLKRYYTRRIKMLNQLHLAMLGLYKGDAKRIQHFCKVHSYAKLIAECEKVDKETLFILEAAALTHDIGIHLCEEKYGDCNGKLQEKEGPAIAARLLGELGFEKQVSERVQYLIAHHHTYHNIDGLDYQILVEADFLVNLFEDNLSKEAALNAYQKIFKTATGKRICKEMFAL